MAAAFEALIGEAAAKEAAAAGLDGEQSRALEALAEQAIHRGIDYATLGLGWDHPQSRLAYRRAEGSSFSKPASRSRQAKSKAAIQALVAALATLPGAAPDRPRQAEGLLVKAFCAEIGAPQLVANASFAGVVAALDGELLLPLRAFSEGLASMFTTFNGEPLPQEPIRAAVHALISATLANRFSEWRYTNPVGARQLEGLTEAQIAAWRAPTSSAHGELRVHEDEPGSRLNRPASCRHSDARPALLVAAFGFTRLFALQRSHRAVGPGELGFWWATKIGGPSHGFDLEGQCLLPLLCNARHKVLLVSDPAFPHNPAGRSACRAHFRLLWVAAARPPRAVLWLEAVNTDFAARVNHARAWLPAVLLHAATKAATMGVGLSVDPQLARALTDVVTQRLGAQPSDVADVADRLELRPSNGVVEASDYLSHRHDWAQMSDEVTAPLRRALYTPAPGAAPRDEL